MMDTETTGQQPVERKVFDYLLMFYGVWGRNRTPKDDNQRLLRVDVADDGAITHDKLKAEVDAALVTLKPKPGFRWSVVKAPVTVTTHPPAYGRGSYTTESYMLASGTRIMAGAVP